MHFSTLLQAKLLRIEQAAALVNRSPRTIRYHARKRGWEKEQGLYPIKQVLELKAWIEERYVNPAWRPSGRVA